MSLRWKLALGFGGLLLLIAGIGIHNIARITALGESIDVILRENYRSVVACQEMKEAIERMDSGAVFVLLGAEEKGNEQITRHEALFENALRAELANVTLRTEGEKAERLAELFRRYRESIQAMRNPAIGREARRKTYFEELQPLFQRIKGSADEILRMNQQNMVDMDARARMQAESVRGRMYLMLLASTLLAGGFLFLTGKWILHPITRLTYSANEIRKGNLDLVVQSGSRDEVGQLSEAFNEMAASLREFRRTGEARLLRIQRSTQRAFDSLPEAIAVVNPEGEVEVATGTAQEAFGLRPKVRVSDLAFPWMPRLLEEALRKGRTVVPEGTEGLVQHFVQNEERFYRPKSVPILDSGGEAAGVVLILQDVTQQRRLDEKKSGAISTVSHQLKTPLTSIRMAIYLLLEEKVGGLSPKQADLLAAAGEDADRLARIVDELLDIGRIESGKARLEFRPVPPDDLVSRQVEAYRAAARDGGLSLVVDLPGSLPKVWVDPARIAHVFSNLLSNALKHTPPGGKVTLTAKADGEYVRFQVSDTGVGIPERHLPRIFEQFFRVPEQGPGSGVGLGLAIVKDIVEAHGGSVGVESREGAGSTFFFTLRRADYTPVEGVRT